jgi:hypothetical protein
VGWIYQEISCVHLYYITSLTIPKGSLWRGSQFVSKQPWNLFHNLVPLPLLPPIQVLDRRNFNSYVITYRNKSMFSVWRIFTVEIGDLTILFSECRTFSSFEYWLTTVGVIAGKFLSFRSGRSRPKVKLTPGYVSPWRPYLFLPQPMVILK